MKNVFNELVKIYVSPFLKNGGYSKKYLLFYKNNNGIIFIINLQNSAGNSYDKITFYINCGIYCKDIELKLGNNILELPKITDCHYFKRIENIIKSNIHSYKIDKDTDIKLLGEQLLSDLNVLVDFYNKQNSIDDLLLLMINENGLNQYEKIFKYLKIVNNNSYIEIYKDKINNLLKDDKRKDIFAEKINKIIM